MSNTELCFSIGHSLSLICQLTSEDMKLYIIIIIIVFQFHNQHAKLLNENKSKTIMITHALALSHTTSDENAVMSLFV